MNSTASKFLTINSLALLLGACLYPSTVFAADRLRIGLSSFTPINAALWIAEEKGLFKKHGIESEVILIGGASTGGVSSLIAGDVQFLGGGGGGVINPALGRADCSLISSICHTGGAKARAPWRLQRPTYL